MMGSGCEAYGSVMSWVTFRVPRHQYILRREEIQPLCADVTGGLGPYDRREVVRRTALRHYEPKGIIDGQWCSGDEGVRIADASGEATGARHGQESLDGVIALRVRIVELRAMALQRSDPLVDIVRDVHHECGRQIMGKQIIVDV